jgi:hypothetical protein
MRKLLSKSEEDKKKKRNQYIVSGILVVVMLFSTLGYAFQGGGQSAKKITYNGFEFNENNGYWFLNLGQSQLAFKYNPKQVENVDSQINKVNSYSSQPLYISSKYQEAFSEIYVNLNPVVQRIQFACEENKTCDGNFPIKNCDSNFIIFELSNETSITQEKNCVFIKSPIENLTQTTDEFLFKIFGIRNG